MICGFGISTQLNLKEKIMNFDNLSSKYEEGRKWEIFESKDSSEFIRKNSLYIQSNLTYTIRPVLTPVIVSKIYNDKDKSSRYLSNQEEKFSKISPEFKKYERCLFWSLDRSNDKVLLVEIPKTAYNTLVDEVNNYNDKIILANNKNLPPSHSATIGNPFDFVNGASFHLTKVGKGFNTVYKISNVAIDQLLNDEIEKTKSCKKLEKLFDKIGQKAYNISVEVYCAECSACKGEGFIIDENNNAKKCSCENGNVYL